MRVGVYIDGFNLYYGGRALCGRGAAGWRWLDLRRLCQGLVGRCGIWPGALLERVVYCTARIDSVTNPGGFRDQDVYLKALVAASSVNHIEYGNYVARVKRALVATEGHNGRPLVTRSQWPLMVRDGADLPVPRAQFMVSYAHLEEKGSDVNVASHLLLDAARRTVDAAIVISNDSDLRLPIQEARTMIPVGLVNPHRATLAGALAGSPTDGVGGHWWGRLSASDFRSHQLPDPCGAYPKPQGW